MQNAKISRFECETGPCAHRASPKSTALAPPQEPRERRKTSTWTDREIDRRSPSKTSPDRSASHSSRNDTTTPKISFLDTQGKCVKHIPQNISPNADTYITDQDAIGHTSAEFPSGNRRTHSHGATNHEASLRDRPRLFRGEGRSVNGYRSRKPEIIGPLGRAGTTTEGDLRQLPYQQGALLRVRCYRSFWEPDGYMEDEAAYEDSKKYAPG